MVARAGLVIDAEARPHHTFATLQLGGDLRPNAALPGELAFAVGDDHLQALVVRRHRLAQDLDHAGDIVGPHRP